MRKGVLAGWTAALGAVFAAGAAPAAAQLERAKIGPWTVGSHFTGATFTHCAMSASYPGGKGLVYALGRNYFTLGIVNPRWNFTQGAEFNGYYQVDDGPRTPVLGKVVRPTVVGFSLRQDDRTLGELGLARIVRAGIVGSPEFASGFQVRDGQAAIARMSACVRAGLAGARPPLNSPASAATPERRRAEQARPAEREYFGTGFYITRAGHILTTAHLVRGCKMLNAQIAGDATAAASIVAVSKADDLALLKTEFKRVVGAPFRADSIRLGEPVVVYGFPLHGTLSSAGNLTSGNVTALAGLDDDHGKIQISAPVQPGSSGGPVLDMRGRVMGLIVSRLDAIRAAAITGDIPQNVNFAVKSSVILSFVEAHGIAVERPDANEDLTVAEAAERARRFTVRVSCVAR